MKNPVMVDMQVGDGVKGVIGYQRPVNAIKQAAQKPAAPDRIRFCSVYLTI
jgi:hypothetical protein